jgi:hypothetical protein
MGWREEFNRTTGPGLLLGIPVGDLVRLLYKNGFQVRPRYWPKVAFAAAIGLITTPCRWLENAFLGRAVAQQTVEKPLFIIGHWRSGTTHLHNLISVDPRFAYANFSQITIPHTFLLAERVLSSGSGLFLPEDRFGVDNVAFHAQIPWEEEFAMCLMTFLSPYMSWVFPHRADYYDRYLTFRDVPGEELERWKAAFVTFLKKLTWKYQRPLVMKSPPHTCRIRHILDLFPDARFVHIHREPYVIYQSTRHLHLKSSIIYSLQPLDESTVQARVIRQYTEMFDVYFAERSLIPKERFCEVSYADLDADPIGVVRKVYEELALPEFGVVEPALKAYVGSLAGYKKNRHIDLAPEVRAEIACKWRRSFDEWNYPL